MTQASIPLYTQPIGVADLPVVLYELTLAVNASGIGSAAIAPPPQPLRASWFASINNFAIAVNAVTAPGTVTLLTRPASPGALRSIVNAIILEINAFVSGGGGGYTAKAVHFDGTVTLSTASLGSTDVGEVSYVIWFKLPSAGSGMTVNLWVTDPNVFTQDALAITNGPEDAIGFAINLFGADPPGLFFGTTSDFLVPLNTWKVLLYSAKTDLGAGNKLCNFYLGDTSILAGADDFGGGSFVPVFSGLPFSMFNAAGGAAVTGDISDTRLFSTYVDFTVEANRRLFVDGDGKPVDPSTATAALGAAGVVLCSGDASTFGGNQGTGGALTLTGSLTNASTSPSD